MALLEVNHLNISFGGLHAVDDFHVSIEKGQLYGLIGPNGAGKTTIFNLLTGVYKPDEGIINLDGQDITGKSTIDINKAGIARTFQNIRLFTRMNVLENVQMGMCGKAKVSLFDNLFSTPKKRAETIRQRERAIEILRIMGLEDKKYHMPGSLPYGEQRRLEIARAMATDPKLLLLDEPVSGIDQNGMELFYKTMDYLKTHYDLAIILISHDLDYVAKYADHVVLLDKTVAKQGTVKEVFESKEFERIFYTGEESWVREEEHK